MENELIEVKTLNPAEVFTKTGCRPVIEMIKEKVKDFVPDLSTAKSRKEIASLAAKVAKSKVVLDDLGKELVADWKERAKIVDEGRRIIRDELDALKDQIRKPLTDWEEAEERRVNIIKTKLTEYQEVPKRRYDNPEQIRKLISWLECEKIDETFGEYFKTANELKDSALKFLQDEVVALEKRIEEKKELDRLREESAKREKEEREKKIAEEAAQRAKDEESRKAKEEIERVEKLKKDAEERARKAEKEKEEALERAEFMKNKAIEEERENERKKKEAEEREAAKRKADHEHRRKLNKEAKDDLISLGFKPEVAESVVASIAMGKVRNIKINY